MISYQDILDTEVEYVRKRLNNYRFIMFLDYTMVINCFDVVVWVGSHGITPLMPIERQVWFPVGWKL